ncbi:hypothetical protein LguiB_005351 [Lonicera macranthoides]
MLELLDINKISCVNFNLILCYCVVSKTANIYHIEACIVYIKIFLLSVMG